MTYAIYTAVLAALVAGYAPRAVYRRVVHGVPLRVRDRLGLGRRSTHRVSGWVHAVSMGEALAAAPLVAALRARHPGLPLVLTTVTETGATVVRERYDGLVTHRFFPLDFPGAVRRIMDQINPRFLLCMETELWPNVLRVAASRGVPVMIANGRLSDRSWRRYRMVRHLLRPVLAGIRVFAMQSSEDARRMIALGADPERVVVTGNLKHEARADGEGEAELWRRLLGLRRDRRAWVAGSTHEGEEEAVLAAHVAATREVPDLLLILAPRHPERVPAVMDLVRSAGLTVIRRSELPRPQRGGAPTRPAGPGEEEPAVVVVDTVGELARLYALGEAAFVGGSLAPIGGHNVLEPALRGKPVLLGPHTSNFREAVGLLLAAGGGRVVQDGAELGVELGRLLATADLRASMGAAAAAASSRRGAVEATMELIERHLLATDGSV